MSIVYDIVLVAIGILLIVRGWRSGALATLLVLLGWAVAAFIIVGYVPQWSEAIYRGYVEAYAVDTVAAAIPPETVSAMNSGADAMQSIQSILDQLGGIMGGQVVDPQSVAAIESALRQDSGSLALSITEQVLEPMLMSLVRGALSVAVLAVSLAVFRFLSRRSARRRRGRGILGKTNQILGGALGVAEAYVVSMIYAQLLSILASALTVDWLTPEIVHGTVIVQQFL